MTAAGVGPRDIAVLLRPTGVPPDAPPHYTIHGADKGVAKRWRDLTVSHGGKLREYYDYLTRTPTRPLGERIFPMKGKQNAGVWECEIGGGARFFYVVDEGRKRVIIKVVSTSHG